MPKISPDATETVNADQEIVKKDTYLVTEREHKDWYQANSMGKQGGMPRIAPKEEQKASGTKKHSLRKEKRS